MTDTDSLVEAFIRRQQKTRANSTAKGRQYVFRKYMQWAEENDVNIVTLDQWAVDEYLFELDDEGYGSKTIEGHLSGLKEFYKYLEKRKLIEESPVENIDLSDYSFLASGTKKSQALRGRDGYYIDATEKELLCDHVPAPKARNELVIRLFWQTGVRRHELADIRLTDINREERTINIRSEKTHANRVVVYHPSLDTLMNRWIDVERSSYISAAESPYLLITYQSPKIGGKAESINKMIKKAAENAGIQERIYTDAVGRNRYKITTHTLRYSFAMQSLNNGMNIKTLKDLMGHSDIETTEDYLEPTRSDTINIARRFGAGTED